MSDVKAKPMTFFDLFLAGQAAATDADDFVTAWHESSDDEQRPLAEFLGFTDDEYDIWTMDRRALQDIAAARRPGGPQLTSLIAERVRAMRAANGPRNRGALLTLTHWLQARGFDPV